MKKLILFLAILFLFCTNAPAKPPQKQAKMVTKTLSGQIDMCLSCHDETLDKAHGREVLGCYSCHLGNPLSGNLSLAHKGMVKNPGELRFIERTCSQEGCHVKEAKWVKNTLMSTNRGIISTLRFYWGETKDPNEPLTVEKLKITGKNSLAIDYFRKLCGTCHLWLERGSLPGFLSEKGGGCTACHYEKPREKGKKHPLITKRIPLKNCVRCHNRSGRIGLSYQGLFENEGYGTPFEEGDVSGSTLPDGRFVQRVSPDIHFEKGLVCIDCHDKRELMGDGKERAHLDQQVETRCIDCHGGNKVIERIKKRDEGEKDFKRFVHIEKKEGKFVLLGKMDKRAHPLNPLKKNSCTSSLHKDLSCQACHSRWVPQCYGCHVRYQRGERQLDKIALRDTYGQWEEFKSYMRYESPVLGVKENFQNEGRKVVIIVPG